jgi:putative hydrolase of the HAD superfamily
MDIRAVIFDLDNTLYDYDAAHEAAFGRLRGFAKNALGLSEADFRAVYDDIMKEQITRAGGAYAAIHNRMIRFQMILERLKKPILYAPRMSHLYWVAFLNACVPVPGVRETLEALRSEYAIGVGTNMTADYQFLKLEKLGLLDLIGFLVSSEEAGVEKPEKRLFDVCAEKAGCPASECVFVGDSLSHDIRGALNAGMSAVWLSPPPGHIAKHKPAPDGVPVIASLSELPRLLRDLRKV